MQPETRWFHYVSYFFGGVFLANALPHLLGGMMGNAFPSPFSTPPGKGLSSSTVNVLWGMFNLAVAYLLLLRVGRFELRRIGNAAVMGLGMSLISLQLASHFGAVYGGDLQTQQARTFRLGETEPVRSPPAEANK